MLIWVLSVFKASQDLITGATLEQQASIELEYSLMGRLGKTIEPVIEPLGYDWKMGVGILIAMGARELFVSTLGTIYALGEVDEESSTLRERLQNEVNPETGEKVFSAAVAWSLLIFFVFAMQCISTLAIVRRETEGWKYPAIMFAYMTVLAYGGVFVTYRLLL